MIKISNHSRLNKKLWLSNGSLRPEAEKILNNMVVTIITLLAVFSKIPVDLEKDIVDIILCGSAAEYFYNKNSDLDMKIIINPDRYLKKMDQQTLNIFSKFLSNYFTTNYTPKLFGISVDVGIVNTTKEMPKYSLVQKKWLIKPARFSPDELKYIKHRTKLYYLALRNMINGLLKDKSKHNDAAKLYFYLRARRMESWNEKLINKSPYSLAFSHINRRGLFKKLLKLDEMRIKRLMTDINSNPA